MTLLVEAGVPLQWGRTSMSAETPSTWRFRPGLYIASMGPHFNECGNYSMTRLPRYLTVELQWGRTSMSAETLSKFSTTSYHHMLQWGRTSMSAETCDLPIPY